MLEYIKDPDGVFFGVYIDDPKHPADYRKCIIDPAPPLSARPVIWEIKENEDRYIEFLLRAEYGTFCNHNLDDAISFMKSHGMKPGHIIGQYLVYDNPGNANIVYDYYQAWIQVLPD